MAAIVTSHPGVSNLDLLRTLAASGVLRPGVAILVGYDPPNDLSLDAAGIMSRKLPGMVRIVAGDACGLGTPSPYSHSMIVEEVHRDTNGTIDYIHVLESTYIERSERHTSAGDWDGIIRGKILELDPNSGRLEEGLAERERHRRYTRDHFYPNIAVLDWGLAASDEPLVVARGRALYAVPNRYATLELIGTLFLWWQGRTPGAPLNLTAPNPLNTVANYFCNAFVSECLQAANPPRAAAATLGVHPSNAMPQHLYADCLQHGAAIHQIVRQLSVPNGAVPTLTTLEDYLRP